MGRGAVRVTAWTQPSPAVGSTWRSPERTRHAGRPGSGRQAVRPAPPAQLRWPYVGAADEVAPARDTRPGPAANRANCATHTCPNHRQTHLVKDSPLAGLQRNTGGVWGKTGKQQTLRRPGENAGGTAATPSVRNYTNYFAVSRINFTSTNNTCIIIENNDITPTFFRKMQRNAKNET